MWDLKLLFADFNFFFLVLISDFLFNLLNTLDPYLQNGFFLLNWKIYYQFPQNMTFFFMLKFCLSISFLILIRGGTPRYRYDYLTKLGWLKFLGLVILVFFLSLLVFTLF